MNRVSGHVSHIKCSWLETAAVVSLAIFLQGMLVWQFVARDFMVGSRGLVVGAVVIALNGAIAIKRGFHVSQRLLLMLLFLAASVLILLASLYRYNPSAYGLWKTQGFALYAVMPSLWILWNHRGRPAYSQLLLRWMTILAVIPLFLPLLLLEEVGGASIRWVLLTLDYDVIGISRSLGIGCLLALAFAGLNRGWPRVLLVLYALVLLYAQILIGERGPILALIVGLCVWMRGYLRVSPYVKRGGAVSLALIVLIALTAISALMYVAVQRSSSGHQENRVAIAKQGLDDLTDSPLLGIGTGRFSFETGAVGTRQFAHNIIGELLVETGLVGLTVFSGFFSRSWWGGRRQLRKSVQDLSLNNNASALFAFSVTAAMVSGDLTTNYMVWVSQSMLFVARNNGGRR